MVSIAAAFLEALPERARLAFDTTLAISAALSGIDGARRRWPALALDPEDFARYVASRLPADPQPDALRAVHYDDLYLAMGCLSRDRAALTAFVRDFSDEIDHVRVEQGLAHVERDELVQTLCERILVSRTDGPPRIAGYRGDGPLRKWVRMVAMRLTVDLHRRDARLVALLDPLDEAIANEASAGENAVVRAGMVPAFRRAFREVVEALSSTERNLLRLRYVHGVSVADLASMQGVHRVTMSRELTRIRTALLEAVSARLADPNLAAQEEIRQALALVSSRLDFSLSVLEG